MSRSRKTALLVAAVLAIFAAGRMILYFEYRPMFAPLGAGMAARAFVHGTLFDLSIILTFLGPPLLLMNLPGPALRSRGWLLFWGWLSFALTVFGAFYLAADIAYFGDVRRHSATEFAVLAKDAHILFEAAADNYLAQAVGMCVFLAAVAWGWRKALNAPETAPRRPWGRFFLLAVLFVMGVRGSFSDKPLGIVDAYARGNSAYGNLALNGAFTSYHSIRHMDVAQRDLMPEAEAREALGLGAGEYPVVRSFPHPAKTGINVVFILLESWGVKYVDSFGNNRLGATPHFDRLAARGVRYTNFYAAGQRSIVGIQATLTGVPPVGGMPTIGYGLEVANISRLGGIAAQNGYETVFLQSSRRRSFMVDAIAGATGFAEYYGREDFPLLLDYPDKDAPSFGWDYEMLMFLKQRLDRAKGPFFAYAFTATTHTPYPPLPERFLTRPHAPDTEEGFLNTLQYVDWSVGRFMEEAEKMPWFKNTVFIFTADHAQVHYGNGGGDLVEEFHIPLLIYGPGVVGGPTTVTTVGSQLDIMPTIIDMMGISDGFSAMGDPLPRKTRRSAFVSEGEVIGIITDKGTLKHSRRNRMEEKYFSGTAPAGYFDFIEKELLAEDHLTYRLLKENRWSK